MRARAAVAGTNVAAILTRLIQPEQDNLSPEAAQAILKLALDGEDRARMHELAVKSQGGALEDVELSELAS